MSKKSELLSIIKGYETTLKDAQVEIKKAKGNRMYSEEGINNLISEIMTKFSMTSKEYNDKAIDIIDSAIKSLEDKWRENSTGKLNDSAYQIGLANAIKMIETGAITSREDFKNIVDVYKDDYNAIAMLRRLLESNGDVALIDLLPTDNREYNKKLLNDLKSNIKQFISDRIGSNDDIAIISISLTSMHEFIDTKLNDDFTVITGDKVSK